MCARPQREPLFDLNQGKIKKLLWLGCGARFSRNHTPAHVLNTFLQQKKRPRLEREQHLMFSFKTFTGSTCFDKQKKRPRLERKQHLMFSFKTATGSTFFDQKVYLKMICAFKRPREAQTQPSKNDF